MQRCPLLKPVNLLASSLSQISILHGKCSISASKTLHLISFLCNNKQHREREYNFTFLPCRSQLTPTHPFYYILSFYLRYEEKNNDTVSVKTDYMYIRSWIWCTLFFLLFSYDDTQTRKSAAVSDMFYTNENKCGSGSACNTILLL